MFAVISALLPVVTLVAVDLWLSSAGVVPAEHPLVLYARTFEAGFNPFVVGEDAWTIRQEWRNDGELRTRPGANADELFILPGFRHVRVLRTKPAGQLRVFVVGGSAVHGLGVRVEKTMPAQLQQLLRQASPGRDIEVHNLGCPGWASDRVLDLVRVLLTMDPDWIVIHTGHNELLRGALDPLAALGAMGRLRLLALRHSALFQWLDSALSAGLDTADVDLVALAERRRSGEVISRVAPPADTEARRAFLAAAPTTYRANLLAMAAAARGAGVQALFLLPSANLRMPPKAPRHGSGFSQMAAYKKALDASRRRHRDGDFTQSLAHLERAVALSPEHGLAHFGRGLTLLALERPSEALQAMRRARDVDAWTHRITSTLEATFLAAMEDVGASFVDVRHVADPVASQDRSLFGDHCHLRPAGHRALANAVLRRIMPTVVRQNIEAHD